MSNWLTDNSHSMINIRTGDNNTAHLHCQLADYAFANGLAINTGSISVRGPQFDDAKIKAILDGLGAKLIMNRMTIKGPFVKTFAIPTGLIYINSSIGQDEPG